MPKHSLVSFHNHDSYSYSDAILNTKEYVEQARMLNASSIAISNHGNLSSWLEFQDHCKKNGVKPIAAVEFYAFLSDEPKEKKSYHVLVIAKTEVGYRNLLKLLHLSATVGFYGKPRISEKMLFEHKEGLAVGNACISGFVTKPLMRGDETSARIIAEQFKNEFGHNYFFEIMPHNNPLQASVNKRLIQIAKELDVNVGVTLDVHFKDRSYEDIYLINGRNRRGITKSQIDNNPSDDCLLNADFHFKDCECIIDTLTDHGIDRKDILAAMDYTVQLDKEINFEFKDKFNLPLISENPDKDLERLLGTRLKYKFNGARNIPSIYKERLRYEYEVIKEKGFSSYFLLLSDMIDFAKRSGIKIGPGRGSAGGCLMAYILGITEVDPIMFNLSFARFQNPFRQSVPDIDVDVSPSGRSQIIEYLRQKYGDDNVIQIITFGEVKAKAAIKEVAKYMEIPFSEVNAITSHIPSLEYDDEGALVDVALSDAIKIPEVASYKSKYPELFNLALKLEHSFKSAGCHAGGVVITPKPAHEIVPLACKKGDEDILMAGWDKKGCEKIGLVKMDLLGLQTLDIISECETLTGLKTQDIPFDDQKTWIYLQNADHMLGIFQLSESKTKRYLREVKPESIKDLSHINTAMRPGSDYKTFITNKRANRIKPEIDTEIIRDTLKETYGALLYQDDLMFVISNTSSLNLGEADLFRRALEKNNKEEIEKYHSKYVETCKHPEKANEIFEWLKSKVGYAFAGAHSAAYSIVGYYTAYYKSNYPHQFLIANIRHARSSGKMTETEYISELIKEARDMGMVVKLPNFLHAKIDPSYNSEDKSVYLGINSLKGIGVTAAEVLVSAALESDNFKDFATTCCNRKVETGRFKKDGSPILRPLVNKSHILTLVKIGFFGEIESVSKEYEELFGECVEYISVADSVNEALGFDFHSPFEAYRKKLPEHLQDDDRYMIMKVSEIKSGQKNGRKWVMIKGNSEIGNITAFTDSAAGLDKNDVILVEYATTKSDAISIRSHKLL